MSDESHPVKVDATNAVTEIAQCVRGWSDSLRISLLGDRLNKIAAQAKLTQVQTDVNADLIRQGHAYLDDNGKVVLRPSAAQYYAQQMIQQSGQRNMENLAGTLELARLEIDSDKNFTLSDQPVDPDFQDFWQDMAEKANHEYARRLWARILKGELQRPGSFPLRTLAVLRQLTQEEAELFTRVARYAVPRYILNEALSLPEHDILTLYDAGLIRTFDEKSEDVGGGGDQCISGVELPDCRLLLHWKTIPGSFVLRGFPLTQAGNALLHIAEVESFSPQHHEKIFAALKKDNANLISMDVFSKDDDSFPPCLYYFMA